MMTALATAVLISIGGIAFDPADVSHVQRGGEKSVTVGMKDGTRLYARETTVEAVVQAIKEQEKRK